MELVLVRHGDAHAGFVGPIGGEHGCRGLTDLGRLQAQRLADRVVADHHVRPDVVITSRVPRAIETASYVTTALGRDPADRDAGWSEVLPGEADGTDWADYPTRFGAFDMVAEPDRHFAPGGDSWNSFHQRIDGIMTSTAKRFTDARVMVVCHAGVIAASLRLRFGNHLSAPVRLVPTHTGITTWRFSPERDDWTLAGYDDAAHLAD